MPEAVAEVMNGTVQAGDIVAYATRRSSVLDMHIASVLEVTEKKREYGDGTVPALKVQVFNSTDDYRLPSRRTVTIANLERVVRIPGGQV